MAEFNLPWTESAPFKYEWRFSRPWDREWWQAMRGVVSPCEPPYGWHISEANANTSAKPSASAQLVPPASAQTVGPGVLVETPIVAGFGLNSVELEWGVCEFEADLSNIVACRVEQFRHECTASCNTRGWQDRGVPRPSKGPPPVRAFGVDGRGVAHRSAGLRLVSETRTVWKSRVEHLETGCVYSFRVLIATEAFGWCSPGPWSAPFTAPRVPVMPCKPNAEATESDKYKRILLAA